MKKALVIRYQLAEVRPASLLLTRAVDYDKSGCVSALGVPKAVADKLRGTRRNARLKVTIRIEEEQA